MSTTMPTIVLVHGAWADASSWKPVAKQLQRDGHAVMALANPLRGITSDSAYIASVLAAVAGPIVLVAHSYGGAVITNAATGSPDATVMPRPFPGGVDFYVNAEPFHKIFAADLPPEDTAVMAAGQRPLALAAFTDASGPPAWKTIPAWAIVATQDNTIGTANTRFMAQRAAPSQTTEIDASHVVMLSHPEPVVDVIRKAVASSQGK